MKVRTIAMMMAVGCVATFLTGCGVPQEEHDAKLAELDAAWTEIEGLKGDLTDKESLLNAEKIKVKNGTLALASATEQINVSKKKEAETASALADEKSKSLKLENAVTSAKAATARANDETASVQDELANLQGEYEKLQSRFEQYQQNMTALNSPSAAPSAGPVTTGGATSLDILNEISAQ